MAAVPVVRGAEPAATRPNFVVLVLDDLGFGDLGCSGGEIRTPNIDGLAADGLRFRRFYNSARCCPTRASLMTGLYPQQCGITGMGQDMSRDTATVAEHLKAAGYATAMTGKWHLSATRPLGGDNNSPAQLAWLNHQADLDRPFANLATYPVNRGFDRHYGTIWGVVDFFDPFSLVDGTTNVREVSKDYYITDAITAKSVEYLRDLTQRDDPFFLYIAHTAPHWPVHARPEDIARYKGRYDAGWHALREERYRKQVALGLIDPKTHPLPPVMGRGPDWDALSPEQRRFEASIMEVHAAMVDRVDQGVGQVVQALKDAGKFANTVFFVLADNGASPERGYGTGFDRPSATRDGRPIRHAGIYEPGSETTWAYIGSHWANALNTPFRFWKAESFEGGTHTPMIVHWPAGLKTSPGSFTEQVGHVIDFAPTCLDLAGARPLTTLGGQPLRPIEGKTLAPIFAGQKREGHDALYFEHEGGRALITVDGWKLVATANGPWQLYHVDEDATETRDLATQESARVASMAGRWVDWAARVGAPVPSVARPAAGASSAAPAPVDLRPGQVLTGVEAPTVAHISFRVEAVVRDASKGGVVVSQGAQVQGWSLQVVDRRPRFLVRRAGELSVLTTDRVLGDGETTLAAELLDGGRTRLLVDGAEVAAGNAGGMIPAQPNDPLIVGDDLKGSVGAYPTPNPFRGSIVRATFAATHGSSPSTH